MASQVKCAYFVACLALLAMFVAAHEGHNDTMDGMAGMAPSPMNHTHNNDSHAVFTSPSMIAGIVTLFLPFMAL